MLNLQYKCFFVEKDNEKIIIKDIDGYVIDILYKNLSKQEIKKYIDEHFKC